MKGWKETKLRRARDGLERGISERLFRFVKQFRRVSSDNVRPRGSLITNEFIRARVYAAGLVTRIIYKETGHARRYRNTSTLQCFRRFLTGGSRLCLAALKGTAKSQRFFTFNLGQPNSPLSVSLFFSGRVPWPGSTARSKSSFSPASVFCTRLRSPFYFFRLFVKG